MRMEGDLFAAMPGLRSLNDTFRRSRPLSEWGVLLHMHMTPETVALGNVLNSGGAQVVYLPSNRNDSSVIAINAISSHGGKILENELELTDLVHDSLQSNLPFLVVEGNGRMFTATHEDGFAQPFFKLVRGISEHTSSGGYVVDAFEPSQFVVPVVAVYRNLLKTSLESGLGTAQTVAAALLRGIGHPVAGRRVGVVGFGNVGIGVAQVLRTLGAQITVVDRRHERCLLAHMAGFSVASLREAITVADICVTATGTASVITSHILERAREGLVIANISNRPDEIDLTGCRPCGAITNQLVSWQTPGKKRFLVLGAGIQVNHAVERGNPAELMDVSFSLHALVLRWLTMTTLTPGVYEVPEDLTEEVSRLIVGDLK